MHCFRVCPCRSSLASSIPGAVAAIRSFLYRLRRFHQAMFAEGSATATTRGSAVAGTLAPAARRHRFPDVGRKRARVDQFLRVVISLFSSSTSKFSCACVCVCVCVVCMSLLYMALLNLICGSHRPRAWNEYGARLDLREQKTSNKKAPNAKPKPPPPGNRE